jgi:hypothetical protein
MKTLLSDEQGYVLQSLWFSIEAERREPSGLAMNRSPITGQLALFR